PLWEMHLIEGLSDGRYAAYFKVHHALVDGVSALRLLNRMMSFDPDERDMKPPWAVLPRSRRPRDSSSPLDGARDAVRLLGEAAGLGPAFARTVQRALREQTGTMSLSAPKSMFNVPITGARRFAAQSWPMERIRRVGKATDTTLNDVVLAMCAGALRRYLIGMDALPDAPLIAMVPVSLRGEDTGTGDGGNAVGTVMCNLATHLGDPGERLTAINRSMQDGKDALKSMTPTQILLMSAIGISPLAILPALGLTGTVRPPFNLVISNVPGPREPLYWNGARLDGLYPLSIPLDGQAVNITCTSYSHEIAFGLTGCRRTVPHLQHLLGYLGDEIDALEEVAGV
ncbi:MAG TPA: wax ester/triacylglycerol synthase family O-acyltransferase, partial [Micromonosporaceae bacterium]